MKSLNSTSGTIKGNTQFSNACISEEKIVLHSNLVEVTNSNMSELSHQSPLAILLSAALSTAVPLWTPYLAGSCMQLVAWS
jgi:hypothetical protein